MGTATKVPETRDMSGEELSGDEAWAALRRYGGWSLLRDAFLRFRYADGFSHSRALALQTVLAVVPLAIAFVLENQAHRGTHCRHSPSTVSP